MPISEVHVYYSQWKYFKKNSWITANCLIRKIIWCTNSSNNTLTLLQLHDFIPDNTAWKWKLQNEQLIEEIILRMVSLTSVIYQCLTDTWRIWTINLMLIKDKNGGHSGAVRTLRSHCQGQDWIPGGETKIPQALRPKEKKKDNN